MYAKAKKIKLEDSNLALYGSKLHKDVKKGAAESEAEYKGAGSAEGLEIWRIEKFALKKWPEEKYGQFFDGDSFIVLRSYKKADNDKLLYDVHFWLGSNTTQDEAGTAAYKTVELDDLLDDLPVQYREVQGFESGSFLKLFPKLEVFAGGIETGFNHVKPTEYVARLLHCKGKTTQRVCMVPMELNSLNDGDCFLLDAGMNLFQFNGTRSSVLERRKVNDLMDTIKIQRNSKPESTIIDGLEDIEEFWKYFGGKPDKINEPLPEPDEEVKDNSKLWKLSDSGGGLELDLMHEGGHPPRSLLTSSDVFLFDVGYQVFCFVGSQSSAGERKGAMMYAMAYVKQMGYPVSTPIIRIVQGCICPEFDHLFQGTGSFSTSTEEGKEGGKLVKWQPTAMGSVEVVVNGVKELTDVQLIGKQDPYVQVTFGKKRFKTETIDNGGTECQFNAPVFKYEITGTEKDDPAFGIEVKDENILIFRNALIGETKLDTSVVCKHLTETTDWYPLLRKGTKPAGLVSLTTTFIPPTTVMVHEARGLRSTEMLTKQDPYCALKLANLKFRSMVHADGHKTPKWETENSFSFNHRMLPEVSPHKRDAGGPPVLHLLVRNKNKVMANSTIGYCSFTLADVVRFSKEKKGEKAWYPLKKGQEDTKEAGEVLISFE